MTSALTAKGSTRRWRELRAAWSNRLPVPCVRCGNPVEPGSNWHLDHPVPREAGGRDSEARPAHAACNLAAGAAFWNGDQPPEHGRLSDLSPLASDSPVWTPIASDPTWDRAGWLDDLRDSVVWPRIMSAPHPRATGSYGADAIAWHDATFGGELRTWQRLVLLRALEHDEAGDLVWLVWILSTARQVGKSWLLRVVMLWRIRNADRFGEIQLALHTGKDLNVCHEVMRPARAWARSQPDWKVREANGQQEIATPDGSRWMVRGRDSLYGYSASLAVVDEAWKVGPGIVEDGLEPTMAERRSPQLALTSTAHRLTTSLVPSRRAAAIAQLAEPVDVLLIEWSAPADAELDDRAAWHLASPFWHAQRERLIAAAYDRAVAGSVSDDPDEPDPVEAFRSQWLNIWPERLVRRGIDEQLLPDGAWRVRRELSATAIGPLALGLEDFYGSGAAAVAVGRLVDGRFLAWARLAPNRTVAVDWLAMVAGQHPGSRLIVGASLAPDPEIRRVPVAAVEPAGAAQLRVGLPLIRELVASGKLVHDGGSDLAEQIERARVAAGVAGLALARGYRADLVRALAFALADLVGHVDETPAPFRIL